VVDDEWAKWDLSSGDKVAMLAAGLKEPGGGTIAQQMAVCPAGDCAALWTADPVTRESRILLHSESAGDWLLQPSTMRSGVFDLVFHPDGKVLFASGHDNGKGVVTAWDVNTGEQLIELPADLAGSLSLSADGNVLVVGSEQFWHLGEWLATLDTSQ
jgi:WD40 repeat protein